MNEIIIPAYFLYGFFGSIILTPVIRYVVSQSGKLWCEFRLLRKEEKKILKSFWRKTVVS